MSSSGSQPLDALTLPLHGERLIEASAGTGKTYTLGLLYLRLLLGLGQEAAWRRPLLVEEILVVTFTEAATQELRERIRGNIHALRLACLRGGSADAQLQALLDQAGDLPAAAARLLAAERQMDDAAIYTIHGFCQRMLASNAFESGLLFEQTLVEDESPLRRQACADFWRRYCYPLPLTVARAIAQLWSGPDALLTELSPWLQGESPALRRPPAPDETLLARHQAIIDRIDDFKRRWLSVSGELRALIEASGVDKRSYSSRYLPVWLDKVTDWAQQETQDYQLPKELEKFSQATLNEKTKKDPTPQHAIFTATELLLGESLSIRELVIARALQEIRHSVQQEKRLRAELGFDDLLGRLDQALQQPGGELLAQSIRGHYPVALIDEFQDTDPQQYRIFHTLYGGQSACGLLLIGDPKQAIYAFRGADIFTYMRARAEVSAHYTLTTNWRSAPDMVGGVNQLFQRVERPFLFEQIPFFAVRPADKNSSLAFELRQARQPALHFWLTGREGVGVGDYQDMMARQCAAQVCDWLQAGQQGEALLLNGDKQRPVQASDITILVRNRNEAASIRSALARLNIPSVYLSSRDSVFAMPEARDVLWILQAVVTPEQESTLRSAMATALMGLDARQIDALSRDEAAWDALVEEFAAYRDCWRQRGVLPMLRQLMVRHRLAENLLASVGGERRLTDVLHIGELIQEAAAALDGEHALVRWLAQQIAQPNPRTESQQLRLESDRHLVRIVTIHKSKGLEYPLVWLPFVSQFRVQQQGVYHDRDSYQAMLDLQGDAESQALAEEERLAEDLRLLYVALTRSVYHCSVGVAPLFQGGRKKEGISDMHHSALGYLLQRGEQMEAGALADELTAMAGENIAVSLTQAPDPAPWRPQQTDISTLSARRNARQMRDDWRVTSYSGLQQHGTSAAQELLPRLDIDAAGERQPEAEPQRTPHTFPRGAGPGTFLHGLFETLDFTRPIDNAWLASQLQQQGLEDAWLPVLAAWMRAILDQPLTAGDEGPRLAQLAPNQRQAELQFWLPIGAPLQAQALDRLAKRYDPLSARCPALSFRQVQGMLKGFIDLVFCWQGRYYLLDYKSNWLGEDASAYTQPAMEQAMMMHRYDLQYQLYSLALHRYLRHRLPDYRYQRHFGGVFYLFLRGIDQQIPGNGVFGYRPDEAFVAALDELFSGESSDDEETRHDV
ncbi:exodeoxyribonuclease V subunit beta [Affinibrenneria salicis]|uniref:RecBCD enzyme subunit RecB n=1 Tax=Affinibrenneria salicis TaxID=2590031 RepID=A0A5J5FVT4_9GAMM|nr:exodeoxyribonuclease V subunit beta [Affinibrenneria salicis]KAA8997615.1 exodeoxyribonuclease V subunit beta [Affinibrenneria salicis]